jgi:hypothetical protein
MDLRGLGAFLSAIAGYFSAQAGAKAGQLQGLLLGEELSERRKRIKMTEEAHQEQMATLRLQRQLQEAEEERRKQLFPYQQEAVSTQVEMGKLNLLNQRLWSMYQRGVVPSQVSDPLLRAEYEPFYNYMMAVNTLQAVQTKEDLEAVLGRVSEELRPSLEILGRANLLKNQIQLQMLERQLQGLDSNLAQSEFQFRTAKLNFAINTILNNINNEGTAWDKRTPQQKIEAVKKWIAQLGLQDVVPEDFANMFQRVKSTDTRQLALLQAQTEMQLQAQLRLGERQFAWNRILQNEAWMSNLLAGALQGGGVAPVGAPALPIPQIFKNTYDNSGSNINREGLTKYINSVPFEISVPERIGNQISLTPLSVLATRAYAIYENLGRPDATLTANDINTLVSFDAGLVKAYFAEKGIEIDWNTAFAMAKERVVATLRANRAYRTRYDHYARVLDDWVQAFEAEMQRRLQRQGQSSVRSQPSMRGQSSPQGQSSVSQIPISGMWMGRGE